MKYIKPKLFLTLVFPVLIFLSFNKHSRDDFRSYHSVVWADAAGYYAYLPMVFLYNNPTEYPDSVVHKTGQGFTFDTINNKVVTKYPSGVSILQAPFFLVSHFGAKAFHEPADGFSRFYQWGIMISGVFFSCMGMFLLSLFLQNYFSASRSFMYVLALLLSTNLYFYSIDNNAMSHVYSFFLFSWILFLSPKFYDAFSVKRFLLLTVLFSVAVLIRPTNILAALFFLLFNVQTKADLANRFHFFTKHSKALLIVPVVGLIVFLPQMLYWKSVYGSWVHYTYGDESFSNWNNPQLLLEWFSTNNGFFLYAPIMILAVVGMILMIEKGIPNGYLMAALFLLISYVFASWWSWWFGCSYGARSFVEYYAFLIIPLAWVLETLSSTKWKMVAWSFVILCIAININIVYYYGGCFSGGNWDWDSYFKLHL